jgi:two-component system sensor histidine kinase YesM
MARKWIEIISLRKIKIFSRLLIMFIFATMLPIIMYGILSYNKSSAVIQEGISQSLESMLIQIGSTIGEKIEKVRNDSIEISYMDEIQDILMNYDSYTDRMKNATKEIITERMSTKYVFDNIVSEITLYTLSGDAVNVYGTDAFRLNLTPEHLSRFLEECREGNGRIILRAMNENYEQRIASGVKLKRKSIVLGKAIKKKADGNIIGYMQMTIEEEKIRSIYRELSTNLSADMFILDHNNIVISSVDESVRVGEPFADAQMLDRLGEERYLLHTGKGDKMVYNRAINNNWIMVSVIPFAYLHADSEPVLQHFILIGLIGIAFGIMITAIVSYSIISPIKRTIVGIRKFESGRMDTRLAVDGNDEVTILAKQFNRMAREIGRLLDNIRQAERQKRTLEIQALQAQINPHFLANTLNMISFIARMRNENSIVTLVNAIINLLRGSMKNDEHLHTVADEIELLKNYVTIQDYRLMGKFDVVFEIDAEIEHNLIPRFVLQPIVENAIIHGIEPSSRRGRIEIRGYQRSSIISTRWTET